ncbi:hypothetical protein ACHAWX_006685 [Stephanocyclus meneghinianus]
MVNKRRQTLATGLAKPPSAPSKSSDSSTSTNRAPRIPKSRKSMIPRVAGQENGINTASAATTTTTSSTKSALRAPSPSKHRKSMGPTTAKTSSTTPSKNRRVSIAPLASESSAANGGGGGGTAYQPTDPRPKDRPYLLSAIRKMIVYLKKHRYPDASSLDAQRLVSHGVSGRDFNAIMTFLLRRLDPGFNTPSAASRSDEPPIKFEEEVSLAFRTLGYPFPISKTGIVAAEHDWADEEEDEEELFAMESNADRATRQFDAFLRKSMVAFMQATDDDNERCAELEAELLEVWETDNDRTDRYLAQVDGEVAEMKGEVEMLERENEGLSDIHKKCEEYAIDIEKFMNLVSQLKEHQSELQAKVSTLTSEKSTMEHQMEELSQKIQRLKDIIAVQEVTVDDARKLERHRARLEEQFAQKTSVLEGHLNALKEANEKYVQCLDLLTRTVQHYNAKGVDLELIPETAKNANGKNVEIQLNEAVAQSFEGLLGVDVSGAAVPHMRKITQEYKKKSTEEKRRIMDLKERMAVLDAASEELHEKFESVVHKITTHQEESKMKEEQLESDIQAKYRQIELLQTKITTLNDPNGTDSAIAKCDALYKDLQALQTKRHKENLSRRKSVAEEIRRAVEAAAEYEKFVQRVIEERNAYARKKKEGLNLKLMDDTW